LTRSFQTVTACVCSNAASFIKSDRPELDKDQAMSGAIAAGEN
jgi:hypothetical protein